MLPASFPVRAVDAILLLVLLEACVLWWVYRRRAAQHAFARRWLANLGAGFCLLAALRAALSDAGITAVMAALGAALAAHVVDLYQRNRLP